MTYLAKILGYLLRFIYDFLANSSTEPQAVSFYALSIIIITVIIKFITIPITIKTQKSSQQMGELQPEIDKLKKKYGYDPKVLQEKTQQLYKEKGVSTMGCSSCLMVLVQFVILLALLRVIRQPNVYMFDSQAQFDSIARNFLWIKDLNLKDPLWYGLPLMTSLSQFGVTLFTTKTNKAQQNSQMASMNTMFLIMPLAYYFAFRSMAAALPLYWTLSSIIEIIFRFVMHFFFDKEKEKEKEEKSKWDRNEKVSNKNSKNY